MKPADRFAPSRPQPGRLLRNGVIIDASIGGDTAHAIAAWATARSVDVIWTSDLLDEPRAEGVDAFTTAAALQPSIGDRRMGVIAAPDEPAVAALAHHAATGTELTLSTQNVAEAEETIDTLMRRTPGARLGLLAQNRNLASLAVRRADDAVVMAPNPDVAAKRVDEIKAVARRERRPLSTLGIAVITPVTAPGQVAPLVALMLRHAVSDLRIFPPAHAAFDLVIDALVRETADPG